MKTSHATKQIAKAACCGSRPFSFPQSGGGRNRLRLWKCTPIRGLAVLALLLLTFYAALHIHISAVMSNLSHMALNQVHDRPVKSKATVRKKLDASHRLQQDDGKEKK